ncbi:hypothetical protein ACL02R_21930 [Streptomyces sp. MS19]|uniref:hypothetical protein n=1 Tax=Streptomyces sp. MS19 TaxID=3385972 RepID=UPI0039A1A3AD
MGRMGPLLRPLIRFAREVGHGLSAGNAIRHGRPPSAAAAAATAAVRAEPPPAVTPGNGGRRPYHSWDGPLVRVRDGS